MSATQTGPGPVTHWSPRMATVRVYHVTHPARWLVSADDRVVASLPADCTSKDLGAAMAHAAMLG